VSTTASRGFAFSIDLTIAFTTMLLMLLLISMRISMDAENNAAELEEFAAAQSAIFLADSIVKNSNKAQPLLGTALYNAEKHRVESGILDKQLLLSAEEFEFHGILIKKLSLREIGAEEQTIFGRETASRNCIALNRLVLLDGKKTVVGVTACR